MPSPHVTFEKRILEQEFAYDWLGNTSTTDDDAHGFYDRSLGTIHPVSGKPYQLDRADNQSTSGNRTGHLETKYDVAGNLTDLAVTRTVATALCLPSGANCSQRFHYEWDEVGRLVRAQRWDTASPDVEQLPTGDPAVDLTYAYDASDNRVLKSATANEGASGNVQRHSVYISGGQELRGAQFGTSYADGGTGLDGDFELSSNTEIAYLFAHGVRLARVAYDNATTNGMPKYTGYDSGDAQQHVLINLDDTIGSMALVIDQATGELVESTAYLAHGGTESDYRPERWKGLREDYRFTGKEEDVEVGLQYFGKRFLSPYLGRWVSADPLAVHAPGKADWNLYAYVHGKLLKNIDPLGLTDPVQSTQGGATGADPNGGVQGASAGPSAGSSIDSANATDIVAKNAFVTTTAETNPGRADPSGASGGAQSSTGSFAQHGSTARPAPGASAPSTGADTGGSPNLTPGPSFGSGGGLSRAGAPQPTPPNEQGYGGTVPNLPAGKIPYVDRGQGNRSETPTGTTFSLGGTATISGQSLVLPASLANLRQPSSGFPLTGVSVSMGAYVTSNGNFGLYHRLDRRFGVGYSGGLGAEVGFAPTHQSFTGSSRGLYAEGQKALFGITGASLASNGAIGVSLKVPLPGAGYSAGYVESHTQTVDLTSMVGHGVY
jgi:RHS repeat-associated protein